MAFWRFDKSANQPLLPCTPRFHHGRCRQWYYYYLTDEGVAYLRQYLHLSEETVPATHKRPAKPAGAPEGRFEGARRGGFKKDGEAPGGFKPRFGGEGGYRRSAEATA